MKKILAFGIFAFALALTNSCKNDLDALAPYKESVAIYGLINPGDTAQYIRVNRVFLGQGNANEMAQIKDSVYFKPDEASVIIEKYWNNTKKQTFLFAESYDRPLQPGVFNTDQLIYKSTQKFASDSAGKFFQYKLIVTNNKSGKQYTATISLIKDITAANAIQLCNINLGGYCFFNQSNVSILPSPAAKTAVKFLTPSNVGICGVTSYFYYHTVFNDNSTVSRSMNFDLGQQKPTTFNGGEVMDFTFPGSSFYDALASNIRAESNLKERVMDSMSFIFSYGGVEYTLYRDINNTVGAFGQEKPIYTNISNGGVGVFSSRIVITVTKKMFDCSVAPQLQQNVLTDQTRSALTTDAKTKCLLFRGPNCAQNTGPGC